MNINNFESRMTSVLEEYIIYLYNEYNILLEFYEMEGDDDDDKTIEFNYDYVTNSLLGYLHTNDDTEHNNNLVRLNEIFTSYFEENEGRELIYTHYRQHLENEYETDDEELIQELLLELNYSIDDLRDYFELKICDEFRDFIRITIDSLNNTILK